MDKKIEIRVIGIAIILILVVCNVSAAEKRSTYIVQMKASTLELDDARYFQSSLESVSSKAKPLYMYKHVLTGYSAALTSEEAHALKVSPHVLSVFAETKHELHTTRTPWFLGLEKQTPLLPNSHQLSNVIIGVVDTGVWPESPSFDDTGLGPVPSQWRGQCETGANFTQSMCNKKLIGARFFSKGYEAVPNITIDWNSESRSPRDTDGHGTHTSTTAAGSPVSGASFFGHANGTARGMAMHARVATYKACWNGGRFCLGSDILAAIDKAIDDKVDVLSVSMGGGALSYYNDPIAIGAFAAMESGILVSCSAGNEGPGPFSLSNVAPWVVTVGAGTLDRAFPTLVTLGNGKNFSGVSLNRGRSLDFEFLPFVYAGNATNDTFSGRYCLPRTLIPEKVKGKIVLCDHGSNDRVEKGLEVELSGGAGMILANSFDNEEEMVADAYLYPATTVGAKAGDAMKRYLFSDPNPTATVSFRGTKLGVRPAPVVASFSSRGPNTATPEILKPDLVAPGVNIIAGWSGDAGPTGLSFDGRRVPFNVISGTSMACPHVSGLAALMVAVHPEWSPAAIRSAFMTTAYSSYENEEPTLDEATGEASTPLDRGSGFVNITAALDPGLVYDLNATDYLHFLCASNYDDQQMNTLARRNGFACEKDHNNKSKYSVNDLNYPSFAVSITADPEGNTSVVKHTRTLTNVGPDGTYRLRIVTPPGESVKISVVPDMLTFGRTNEKKSYKVTFEVSPKMQAGTSKFGRIEWYNDQKRVVGSPIAITWMRG